ncbi:formylmethanofuran dehydrogenase (plasmid) [Citrobacter amalonaticus Y19]|uniref:Formylmethanofuran dehydrogenase n=1 Tax=Citrobacter amalonaticus Y19 TaxID=1261127 RepID=A0A0F6U0G2_CITAM|nr:MULTISPECIES: FmdE family protein [Citrobacter]AKE62257.1 formylmethanofuran dehydrogenase [Citrobacter amalonaticus Y19]EHX1549054.1 formylmethanofuran dehydrogenase [Escherichia coli]NWO39923.1 formylmethanofuran dehydrogenase [Citrobacter freundii]
MNQTQFEMAMAFHGHKCPAMPLGFRAAEAAMKQLGVERSQDKELYVISETGKGHAAGCFLDGVMSATGCTYGKSNIEKRYYNKMAFTLIDVKNNKSVRVRLTDDFFGNMLNSPFVALRKQGVPPQDISPEITEPLVNKILSISEEAFLEIGQVQDYTFDKQKGCFETALCSRCGERVFMNKLTKVDSELVCVPCLETK